MMKKIIVLMLLLLLLAGCGGAGTQTAGFEWVMDSQVQGLPEVDSTKVEGDIVAAGSSTVYPLAERMAERFADEGYSSLITIDSIGSGGGFRRFSAGESDISNASRPIKESERSDSQAIGIDPIEFRVGELRRFGNG